jgi:creatinine amidohydrolase
MRTRITRRASLACFAGAPLAVPSVNAAVDRAPNGYIDSRKVKLWESTRKEFRERLESGALKALIVPTGSTEQHNEHLAMIHDTASVSLVAELAALRLFPQAMVATPVSIGISPHWMDRKGTLSLRKETFLAVVYEICESLKTHGVRNILVLNGHGGNVAPLQEAVPQFREKLGINVQFNSYWDAYTPEIIGKYMESNKAPGHAAEFETSFAMAAFPERIHWEGVDYQKIKGSLDIKSPASAKQEEEFAREARLATTAKGEAMMTIAVEWVAARIEKLIAGA